MCDFIMWLSKRVGFGRNRKECEHFSRTNFMEMKTTLLASDCPTSERERERERERETHNPCLVFLLPTSHFLLTSPSSLSRHCFVTLSELPMQLWAVPSPSISAEILLYIFEDKNRWHDLKYSKAISSL